MNVTVQADELDVVLAAANQVIVKISDLVEETNLTTVAARSTLSRVDEFVLKANDATNHVKQEAIHTLKVWRVAGYLLCGVLVIAALAIPLFVFLL